MCCIFFLTFVYFLTCVISWNYKVDGPDRWGLYFSACNGMYQSPINIPTILPDECDNTTKLQLNWDYASSDMDFVVRNNGHTMVLTPIKINDGIKNIELLNKNRNRIAILNNIWYNTYKYNDNKKYCLDSLHFHWGFDGTVGSEHIFDNQYSAFEAHFLHYSCDYESLGDALHAYNTGKTDDKYVLSAIGILFDVGEPNKAIQNIVNDNIINEVYKIGGNDVDNEYKISHIHTSFNINDLLPENKEFVSYHGSITAPPCNETVRWNVLTHKLTISNEQLDQFRKLLESNNIDDKLINNYRPIQNNTNKLYYCQSQINDMILEPEKETHVLPIIIIAGSVIFFFICLIGIRKYNKKRREKGFPSLLSISKDNDTDNNNEVSMKKVHTNDKYACYH